jgi:putative redox protein
MDGAPESGGQNKGARPMELVLIGMGGCTAFDVVHILRKSRQKSPAAWPSGGQRAEPTQGVHAYSYPFVVSGRIWIKKVQHAIELSRDQVLFGLHHARQDEDHARF